jgi:hypothetical protein
VKAAKRQPPAGGWPEGSPEALAIIAEVRDSMPKDSEQSRRATRPRGRAANKHAADGEKEI